MILLVDAYNVLKQTSAAKLISAQQRAAFVARLSKYAQAKQHTIIVVFDGTDDTGAEYRRPLGRSGESGSIRVIYSGYKRTADEVLKTLCQQFQHLQTVLVSSDRELCTYAHLRNIACVEAVGLYELLKVIPHDEETVYHEKQKGSAIKREGHQSSAELDRLMQASAHAMFIKTEDAGAHQRLAQAKQKTLSKHEKKIKKLVNKL